VTFTPPPEDQADHDALEDLSPSSVAPTLPEPPPAEDENQPGFIGERHRPMP